MNALQPENALVWGPDHIYEIYGSGTFCAASECVRHQSDCRYAKLHITGMTTVGVPL